MKASSGWLATAGAEFSAGVGPSGCAHLTHYTVSYREWGAGPPLVLVPGLAGGYELLGPLADAMSIGTVPAGGATATDEAVHLPAADTADPATAEAADVAAEDEPQDPTPAWASIDLPIGFSLVAVLTFQFRETLGRWLGRFHPSRRRRRRRAAVAVRHALEHHQALSQLRERS